MEKTKRWILFDWGDTVMRVFPEYSGAMVDWPEVQPIPHIEIALAALLPLYHLGLATNAVNSDEGQIWAALERANLESFFERVFCFRSLGLRKPAPEFFKAILKELGVKPDEVIMVGDELEVDIRGARLAGLSTIWFNETQDPIIQGDRQPVIQDMRQLAQRVSELWEREKV